MSANAKLKLFKNAVSKVSTQSHNPPINLNQNQSINTTKHNALITKIKETTNLIPKPKPVNTKKPLINKNAKIPIAKANNPSRNNNFSKANMHDKPLTTRDRSRSCQSIRLKDLKSTPPSLNSNQNGENNVKESTQDQTTNNQCFNIDMSVKEINMWNNSTVNDPILTLNELKERSIKLQEDYDMISRQTSQSLRSTMELTNKQLNSLKEHYKIFNDNKHPLMRNPQFEEKDHGRNYPIRKDLQENINSINLGVFNKNYENHHIHNSRSASFTSHEYRQLLDTLSMLEYGSSILSDYFINEIQTASSLENHEINSKMRMKMVDWMIEVFSSFKCGDNTFFLAVMLMDRFFLTTTLRYTPADLHLIGITCIFIASKFCDVYPIKLKAIIEKISHSKYTSSDVTQMEDRIMTCLDYNILLPTTFDFLNFYFEDLFFFFENNFNIKHEMLSEYLVALIEKSKLSIKLDMFYFDRCASCRKYTDNMINFLYCTIVYLAKMCCHDYAINSEKPSLVAASVLLVGLRICEEVNNESYVNELFLEKLTKVSRHSQYAIFHLSQKVLFSAQNYEKVYCGMESLKLKHFYALASIQETK